MSDASLVAQFTSITGAKEEIARNFLQSSNGNLEIAISTYFETGADQEQVSVPPPASLAPPTIIPQVPDVHSGPTNFLRKCVLSSKGEKIPLKEIVCKGRIQSFVAEVELVMKFVNTQKKPLEAVFKFKQEDCSIFDFETEIEGKKTKGICKEKEEAFDTYDDSIASGHGAYLVEEGDTKGTFRVFVGNIPIDGECQVTLRYLQQLNPLDSSSVSFHLPVSQTGLHSGIGGKTKIELDVEMPSEIIAIESPSHTITKTEKGKKHTTVRVDDSGSNRSEFVLRIITSEPHKPFAQVERHESSKAVMVSFLPQIETEEDSISEIIFIVDRSGSMSGGRMRQAKNALLLFLKSLPEGTKFNIIGFGNYYQSLFPQSVDYSESSLARAMDHVTNLEADLGGTDILGPLQNVLSRVPDSDFPRQIFLLTDGEVTNTDQVINMVAEKAKSTRIFTFGIGADASKYLVTGVAAAGKGYAEFVATGERMESIVLRQLKRALKPIFKKVTVDWGALKVRQAPLDVPPIFDGQKLIICGFLENQEEVQTQIKLTCLTEDTLKFEFPVQVDTGNVTEGCLIHRLAARLKINELEDSKEEQSKDEIVTLATKFGLVSKFTSIVAVEVREEATQGNLSSVQVLDAINEAAQGYGDPFSSLASIVPMGGYQSMPRAPRGGGGYYGLGSPHPEGLEDYGSIPTAAPSGGGGYGGYGVIPTQNSGQGYGGMPRRSKGGYEGLPTGSSGGSKGYEAMFERGEIITHRRSSFGDDSESDGEMEMAPRKEMPPRKGMSPRKEKKSMASLADNFSALPPPSVSSPFSFSASPSFMQQESIMHPPPAPMASSIRLDSNMKPFDRLVFLQQANGSWQLNDVLLQLLGLSTAKVEEAMSPLKVDNQAIWATALAIASLEIKFLDMKEDWELLCSKAQKWLRKECLKLTVDSVAVLNAARSVI